MIKYVQGVVSGKHKGNDLFGSLLQVMVLKADKENRGVGMQNFQYAPNLIECAHIVFTHSPKAYEFLQEHLAMPDPRTLRLVFLLLLSGAFPTNCAFISDFTVHVNHASRWEFQTRPSSLRVII